MKKNEIIDNLKKALEDLDITSPLRLLIIQTIEYLRDESIIEDLDKAAREDAKVVRSDDTEVGYNLDRYSGFISGAEWRLAQMMAKAVDGHATFEFYGIEGKAYGTIAHYPICLDDLGLKDTDKCKMIIIKEG